MILFDQVTAGYGKKKIIENITLEIPEGQITAVIGPNGCGKSTLIKCLNEETQIFSGTLYLDEKPLGNYHGKDRAKKIALLPQIRQVPVITVKRLVEHGRFPYLGFSRRKNKEDEAIVQRAMEFTDVKQFEHLTVDTLSGGQRQRVFLAMALAQDCQYLILDEPTTFMDIMYQREFLQLVLRLKEEGKTVVFILHDIIQALRYADRIVIMDKGKICSVSNPDTCLKEGWIQRVFHTELLSFQQDGETYFTLR